VVKTILILSEAREDSSCKTISNPSVPQNKRQGRFKDVCTETKNQIYSQIRKAELNSSVIADTLKWSNQKRNQIHSLTCMKEKQREEKLYLV